MAKRTETLFEIHNKTTGAKYRVKRSSDTKHDTHGAPFVIEVKRGGGRWYMCSVSNTEEDATKRAISYSI